MIIISRLAVQVNMLLLVLINIAAQQPKQAPINKDCVRPLLSKNRALSDSIQVYLRHVGNYEIPIIAVQTVGDTTHYYITAFMATYMIKQNPPSALVTINKREVLLYSGQGSIAQIAPNCYDYLLRKYSQLLHVDKLNLHEGRPPSFKYEGFLYDPIMGDVFMTKQGKIGTKHAKEIPFIKYD